MPLAQDDNLASWNPHVECGAVRATIAYLLGPAYPNQQATGAPYHTNGTSGEGKATGGIPSKRALCPPCSSTHISGQVLTAFVQVEGVYLASYGVQTLECSNHFKNVNGGGPFPNNQTLCDSQGKVYAVGTTNGFLVVDIDQDWMGRGYCGPGVSPCDNVSLGQYVSSGHISLDLQGFVYWDGENWKLHPLTAVRLSTGLVLYPETSSLQTARNYSASAVLRLPRTSADPVALTVSGCPAETTCAFTPATGVARFDSTFRVNTTPASPLGNFDLTITATNASASTTVPFHLTIADRASLTFRRGDGTAFGETDDLYIYSGATTTNYGTALKLLVDGLDCIAAGTVCKTLIKFPSIVGPNPGQIPAGSRIVNASLGMTIRNKGQTEDAYQITEAWDEASASWNSFAVHGVPGNRGKEFTFAPDHLGRFPVNVTSITQRWANGEVNYGVLLASTHWDGVDYNSSETVRDRPSLRVQFVPPPSPLVLAYDMETLTPDGRMQDRSGNGHHGTMTGTGDVFGKVGRARHFGAGDRITAAGISVQGLNFTIAAWFNWTTNPSPYYSGIQGGGCCSWELRVRNDGRFAVIFYQAIQPDVYTAVASPLAYNDGTWHHAAGILRSGLAELYVDGVLVGQSITNPIASVRTSLQTVVGHVASDFFGDIDEIRVFSRALSVEEIITVAISSSYPVWQNAKNGPDAVSDSVRPNQGNGLGHLEQSLQGTVGVSGISFTRFLGGVVML